MNLIDHLTKLRMERMEREDQEAAARCGRVKIIRAGNKQAAVPRDFHGSVNGYTNRKCRCELCREAARVYYKARNLARKVTNGNGTGGNDVYPSALQGPKGSGIAARSRRAGGARPLEVAGEVFDSGDSEVHANAAEE